MWAYRHLERVLESSHQPASGASPPGRIGLLSAHLHLGVCRQYKQKKQNAVAAVACILTPCTSCKRAETGSVFALFIACHFPLWSYTLPDRARHSQHDLTRKNMTDILLLNMNDGRMKRLDKLKSDTAGHGTSGIKNCVLLAEDRGGWLLVQRGDHER